MCRTLLLPLVVGGFALGLPFGRSHLAERDGRAAASGNALADTGVLAVGDSAVRFTLYWPDAEPLGDRPLVIFAADALAAHPRPLRLFAQAAAATGGVAAVYLEPTPTPAQAALRLQGVLQRQASSLGIDADAVWTWVEGKGLRGTFDPPCTKGHPLAAAVAWLRQDVVDTGRPLVRWALDRTLGVGCSLKERL